MNKTNFSGLKRHTNRLPHIPKEAGVYLITDTKTMMKYVGSSADMNKRLSSYLCATKESRILFREVDLNSAKFEVLEKCKYLNEHQRLELEREHILRLNTVYPNGLNRRCPVTKYYFTKEAKPDKVMGEDKTNYGKPPKGIANIR